MATESVDQRESHIRGLTVTTLACVAGIGAAIASSLLTAGSDPATAATNTTALYALVGAVLVQFPVLKVLGIDIEDFSTKDYLYVAFMTFSLWFVSWSVLLTANTTF